MAEGVSLDDPNLEDKLTKSDKLEKIGFEASVSRGVQSVFKADDEFVIWGPASVEIVDKEGDKIKADALDNALPQLLQRARLSLEHSDQIVGRILERFETEDPVTVEINGQTYERNEFPTDVLDLDDGQPPALYVAGEVFADTQQSKRARERIQDGELDSYSISGEALVTRKKVEDGIVYDDIVDMDLSAVTLCEEGMNQGAKYARVDAEVSDKELAGEASDGDVSKRQEVPVLEHPSMSGVEPAESTSSGTSQRQTAKSMSDNPEDGEEKSEGDDGPGIEDVLKRLPEEGELATKDDLDEVQEKAVETVQESLPDGDLATISAMESLVDEKVDEKYDPPQGEPGVDDDHGGGVSGQATDGDGENYGSDGPDNTTGPEDGTNNDASPDSEGGSDVSTTSDKEDDERTPAEKLAEEYDMDPSEVQETLEASAKGDVPPEFQDESDDDEDDGDDEDDEKSDDSEESQSVEEKADSVRDARDKLADELGVDKDEVNTALTSLLEAGDDPDGDGEEETVDEEDLEDPDGDGEDEVEVVEDEEDGEDEMEEPEMDDESDDEEGESYERLLERLEEDLPADVWEVVREYVKADVDKSKETFESPADILRGSEDSDGEEGDVNKAVQNVLEGGAEVQGGQAIPTDPDDDQVDKQYSPAEEDGEGAESPALQNFYG